jgi:ABC-type branched-subunit amino acid transport system substrate-binding protein
MPSIPSYHSFGSMKLFSRTLCAVILAAALAGCVGSYRIGGASRPVEAVPTFPDPSAAAPGTTNQNDIVTDIAPADGIVAEPLPVPSASGRTKIALILPLSAAGTTGVAGLSLKNAAEMATAEYKGATVDLIFKDDKGTPEGARIAVKEALAEGASAMIGPLLATSVQAAGPIAKAAGKPMLALSTDAGVAAPGVYLISFMPQGDVERAVDYAAAQGKKAIAALIPETVYGSAVNAALQNAAARRAMKIIAIERYTAETLSAAAKRVGGVSGQFDTLFVPENGDGIAAMAQALLKAGIDGKKVQLIGTSAWDDPRVLAQSSFNNGWFAMPDKTGFAGFSARYQVRFGAEPVRIATLVYDAVFLANALNARLGPSAFTEENLTIADGVIGTDGLFRLLKDGTNQRALAMMKVDKGTAIRIDAPPKTF